MTSEQTIKLDGRLAEIATAARSLIAERGFEGLRTRDIAARVGINIATLHYHVPSKEALIRIVAQSLRQDFIDQHRARSRDGATPLERLRLEFADFRETLTDEPERLDVLAELSARAIRDAEVASVMRPMQTYWHGQISEIVAEGVSVRQFRADADPQAAATMVIGTMISARRALPDLTVFDRACAELERALIALSSQV